MSYPRIGKNVIEVLTTGMYEDPRIIFREYVQNAADSIDKAVRMNILQMQSESSIHVEIIKNERKIRIRDNGTGIESQYVESLLGNIAESEKIEIQKKGFEVLDVSEDLLVVKN